MLSALVVVPDVVFERHSPYLPQELGNRLAEDVCEYVREHTIGYYPALDYLHEQKALRPELLDALDQLTWLATSLTREEVRVRLRPVYAGVSLQSIQAVAYSMPQIRHNQPNAQQRLAEHYTPNRVKFDVMLTLFRKTMENDNLSSFIENVTFRHLEEPFDRVDINAVKVLE